MSGVPYIFGNATTSIPLSQLDVNFATNATLGNATVGLGNTTTTVGNLTVQNVTLSSTNGDANIHGLTVGQGGGSVSTNTAVGASALAANTSGASNTAVGQNALNANTASSNTAVGYQAGYSNQTGTRNALLGYVAGYSLTGNYCTLIGAGAGYSTTGDRNTFVGDYAGNLITTGTRNTIIGKYDGNTGGLDIRTSSNYIVLSDGDGNPLFFTLNGGGSYLPGVYVDTTASAANMFVRSDGRIQRSTSALKYKQDVRDLEEMDISLLRAVRYKSKCGDDDQNKDHLGLIADEAAEAGFEELVTRGADGEVEGFQYERLTVVLLKKLQVLESEFKAYKEAHP